MPQHSDSTSAVWITNDAEHMAQGSIACSIGVQSPAVEGRSRGTRTWHVAVTQRTTHKLADLMCGSHSFAFSQATPKLLARRQQVGACSHYAGKAASPDEVMAILRPTTTRAAGGKEKSPQRVRPAVGVSTTDLQSGVVGTARSLRGSEWP